MSKGYRKIFWGTILVSFLSPGGSISLVLVLIGWTILKAGLGELEEQAQAGDFKRLGKIAVLAAALSLAGGLLYEMLLMRFPPIVFYPIMVLAVELILFHGMFTESIRYFSERGDGVTAGKYREKDRNFMVLVGIAVLFLSVFYTFNTFVTGLIGISFSLISKIYLLGSIHALKIECDQEETGEEEQSSPAQ